MALLGGESLLAIELLENYQPTGDGSNDAAQSAVQSDQQRPVGAKKEEVEGAASSCDAELFVLLLQRYTEPTTSSPAGLSRPKSVSMQIEHWRRVCKYKSGLILEALATQRSMALCGKASLPVLLPMLDALLQQPTDTLTKAASSGSGGGSGSRVAADVCKHDQHGGVTVCRENDFLSGESAEEQARARIAAVEGVRDAIDTLQLVLGASRASRK